MSNKVAIVTGYSSGLGYEFCKKLLESGWTVIGISRSSVPEDLVKIHPEKLIIVKGSVADPTITKEAFDIANKVGKFQLLINSAGVGVFGEVGKYTSEEIKTAIEGNLEGLILMTDTAVDHLKENGGKIVNVMSTAAKKLRPAESVYVAVKWAAKAYTRTIREALKVRKLPIKIYEVYPCGMNTDFWVNAVRPVANKDAFPEPEPIASEVLNSIFNEASSYQQEFTFERS